MEKVDKEEKDTRKTFVDHLYTALENHGIYTYKDDEALLRGESIDSSLVHAIRGSRIAVIVFSENYADSCWCLDELAYIMECMDTRGQIVLPVFYGVDPSGVRKQTGKYGEVFANKHELENNHKVESWKKALANAGKLSGWVTKDIANGHEAKCIKEIVRTISSRLSSLFSNDDEDLIGMETRLEDLESKLKIGLGGVRFVGLWGVGGSGKTTLASFAYKKFSPDFDDHCILNNIREESSKHDLKDLQEKHLSRILKTNVNLDSEEEGRRMIKKRFGHKNLLIVLDDVDDLKQLDELAGSHDWFGKGSRIIITTRDEHVVTRDADEIYGMSLLSEDEAIKLFNRHAYREVKPVEDYESLSLDVVSYAGGLPLALKVLGSSLYDKDKNEWISYLAKLRDIPEPKIMDKLKISYDALQSHEKELFLDIACVLRGWPLDEAKMVLDACNFHTVIGVRELVQKSLINVSNGIFDMHDLIEEMAHYIVIGEHPKHPERLSRVWREKDVSDICSIDIKMENDETEVIVLPPRLPHDLEKMNRLWKFNYYPTLLPSHVTNPHLPTVVANMKKLRWIYWEGYPESSLPKDFQPINLGCLMLTMGRQKVLWQGYKHLPSLRILDLRYSKYLKRTPDFKGLPLLERLNLKACVELKEIHSSIGYLERLVLIDMEGCSKVQMFPPIMRMKKLETLKLSDCEGLKNFPIIQTNMDSLKYLYLDGTGIEIVPTSVGQFCTNLESFNLQGCQKLKTIEGNFRLLKHLKYLNLKACRQLEKLDENFFDEECCLDELLLTAKNQDSTSFSKNFMNCIGLHTFHKDSCIKLPKFPICLRELDLSWSNLEDGDISSDIFGQLLNLQILNLRLNKFSRLDSSLLGLLHLKSLDISDCCNLVELPDLPLSICILKATGCDSLENVGDLSKYKCLWKVSFWRENKLIGGERVLHSILQRNVKEDRFMSVTLPGGPQVTNRFPYVRIITLQLPQNWENDFSGFLFCADNLQNDPYIIFINTNTSMFMKYSQPDHWEEFDKNPESYDYALAGYIPFSSLQDHSHRIRHKGRVFRFGANCTQSEFACDLVRSGSSIAIAWVRRLQSPWISDFNHHGSSTAIAWNIEFHRFGISMLG
ncbi:hypothetical protein R6Q59_030325 [Mikania micrantha]